MLSSNEKSINIYENLSDQSINIKPVGIIHTSFPEKFGIPRQSGLLSHSLAYITFIGDYANPDCIRGIDQYSHLWLLWQFSKNPKDKWSPTVRPPRLGGNERVGVFATRSPFRPNPIGLSSVKLVGIIPDVKKSKIPELMDYKGPALIVSGADLMDKTPIMDIKPYLPYTDSHPDAEGGFATKALDHRLMVDEASLKAFADKYHLRPEEMEEVSELLSLDPRPSYHEDPERIYGMTYKDMNLYFNVKENIVFLKNH